MAFYKKYPVSAIEDQTLAYNDAADDYDARITHTPPDRYLNKYASPYSQSGETDARRGNTSATPSEDIYLRHRRFEGTIADETLSGIENAEGFDKIRVSNQALIDSKKDVMLDDGTRAYLYDDGSILYRQGGELTDGTTRLENKAEREFRRAGYNVGPDARSSEQTDDPDAIFDEKRIRFVEQRRLSRESRDDASRIRGRLLNALNNYRDNPFPESDERKLVDRVLESLYEQAEQSAMIGSSEFHELPDGTIIQINNLNNILDTIEREEAIRRREYSPQYVDEDDPGLDEVIDLSSVKVLKSKRDINRAREAFGQTGSFQFGLLQRLSRSEPPDRLSVVRTARDPIVRERELANVQDDVDLEQIESQQEPELARLADPDIRRQDEHIRQNREDIIERVLSGEQYDDIAEAYDVDADIIEMFYTGRDKEGNVFIGAFRPRDIALAKRRRRDRIDDTPPEDQMFSESRSRDSEINWRESRREGRVSGYDDEGYEYSVQPYYNDQSKYSVSIAKLDNLITDSSRSGIAFDNIEEAMDWAENRLRERMERDNILASRRTEYAGRVKPTKDNIDLAVAIAYHKYIGSQPEMKNNPYEDTDLTPGMMARDLLEDPIDVYGDTDDRSVVSSADILRIPVENRDEVVDFIENTAMDIAIEDYLDENPDKSCPEDQMFSEDRQLRDILNRIHSGDTNAVRELNQRRREIVEEERQRYLAEKARADIEREREIQESARREEETESTASDIEEYLRRRQEFTTPPEDQYLMVNVHGADERDDESKQITEKAENIPLFDSDQLSVEKNNNINKNRPENKVVKYFNDKQHDKSDVLQTPLQHQKLNARKTNTGESSGSIAYDKNIGNFGKVPFRSSGKKDDLQLYDENVIENNTVYPRKDKENNIIRQGVMAQARRLVD